MTKIGYVRVSTQEQNTERQLIALKEQGVNKIFEEKISGKDAKRPQLQKMLEFLREGDILYIESISRLARNTLDLLQIVEQLKGKGVGLVSLKESIDTTTPQGQFMLSVFGSLSQLEREVTLQRQREGINIALAKGTKSGRPFGRPKVEAGDKFKEVYHQWKGNQITAVEAMRRLGMTRCTFYRRVNEHEQPGGR